MSWSKTPPPKEGWYWFKNGCDGIDCLSVCNIIRIGLAVNYSQVFGWVAVKEMDGEWWDETIIPSWLCPQNNTSDADNNCGRSDCPVCRKV